MDSELEKLCETLAAEGITVQLRRFAKVWQCSLYERNNRLYSTPTGHAETAIAAVNNACDQRLVLLLQDGN